MMFKVENLKKPRNRKWKLIAKSSIYILTAYMTTIANIPDSAINPDLKLWIGVTLSLIVATINGLSEFTTENEVLNNSDAPITN